MDFEKICRLCCEEKWPLRQILDNSEHELAEIFSNLLQIVVFADDNLPQQICEECIATLLNLNETVDRFQQNDLRLRYQLVQACDVKEETVEQKLELGQPKVEPADESDDGEPEAEASIVDETEEDGFLEESMEEPAQKSEPNNRRPKRKIKCDELGNEAPLPKRKRKRNPNLPRINDHKCYICKSESLGSAGALFEHLNVNHPDEVPYTCPLCVLKPVFIKNVFSLNVHKKMHELPFKCLHCDKHLGSKPNLQHHIDMLHSEDPSECLECSKILPSKLALKHHMDSHKRTHSCEFCGKLFNGVSKMNVHINRKHGETSKVKCHICKKDFNSLDAVLQHTENVHSNQQFTCSYCSKIFTNRGSFRRHEKNHLQDPSFEYQVKPDWKNYYTVVEENGASRRKCNLCDKVVVNIGSHLSAKHFPRKFPCDLCDLQFRDKKTLAVHKLEHSKGKFLKCPICGREFTERRNLIAHLQTKKHRDHPKAQSLDWLDEVYPTGRVPKAAMERFAKDLVSEEDLSSS